jgi:hypothetical protein
MNINIPADMKDGDDPYDYRYLLVRVPLVDSDDVAGVLEVIEELYGAARVDDIVVADVSSEVLPSLTLQPYSRKPI